MDPKAALMALLSAMPLTQTCGLSPAPLGGTETARSCFASADAGDVRSALSRRNSPHSEHLYGITDLPREGLRLVEDVTLDESGALKSAEALLTRAGDTSAKRVLIDSEHGTVDVTSASVHLHWVVPRDYPWIWAPLLTADTLTAGTASGSGAPITTPLDARVVWRASAGGRTVRLLDLGTLKSYTLTADQVATREGDVGTVVLGSDTSDIDRGMPKSMHLAGMNTDLVNSDLAPNSSALLAVAGCSGPRGLFAR
jgi:hypothetical protein